MLPRETRRLGQRSEARRALASIEAELPPGSRKRKQASKARELKGTKRQKRNPALLDQSVENPHLPTPAESIPGPSDIRPAVKVSKI